MKKYALLCLGLMLFCFITGGIYIVTSIKDVTGKLERVISFHKVEFLRANLFHHIEAVQTNLLLQGSPHDQDFASTIELIEEMEKSADICQSCHHTPETRLKLDALEEHVELYMKALSRTLTIRANSERLENARKEAFATGEEILRNVTSLSVASADKISARITRIHSDINRANNILIACLVLGPIAIFIITIFFLNRFAGSITTLVTGAKQLESGDLSFRIKAPLKNEFRTLARAFNGMASALEKEQQRFTSVHQLYQTLFESAGDSIMIIGLDKENFGRIISANKASTDLYGYQTEELLGMDITRLVPEEKQQKFRSKIRKAFSGQWTKQVVKRIRKDGTEINVDQSMGLLNISEQKYLLTFCRDVTEKLKAEQEMQRANQMAVVGQMSAGLAHELKNPLAGIRVSLDVLSGDLKLTTEDQEDFARIINEVTRMERLLKELLNYARPPQPHFDLVNINRLLDQSLKNAKAFASSKPDLTIQFETDFASDLQQIEADASQLQQVLLNILLNATEAIASEGKICATTRNDGGENILIKISDTGKGMSAETLENAFAPFFTTSTKGTGLGLAICKRLIEQHGGIISVDSQPGSGTSIVINLPTTQQSRE